MWTVGNFASGKVVNFRVGPTPEVGGELQLPGGVYLISTSNVN